jgi:hypothetical protein
MFYSERQVGVDTVMRRLLNYTATSIFLNAEMSLTLRRHAVYAVQSSSNEALDIYRNLMCVIKFVVAG